MYINLETATSIIADKHLNLCPAGDFERWTHVAHDIACTGEEGLDVFKAISAADPCYRERDCESRYRYEWRLYRGKGLPRQPLRRVSDRFIPFLLRLLGEAGVDQARIESHGCDLLLPVHVAIAPPVARHDADPKMWTIPMSHWEKREAKEGTQWQCYNLFNGLLPFVKRQFGTISLRHDPVREAILRYRVGLLPIGSREEWEQRRQWTGFPYIDEEGRLRTAKLMAYSPLAHRLHDVPPRWLHRERDVRASLPSGWHQRLCFFGQHLVPRAAAIGIVESEKTALLMSMAEPGLTWLACGGKSNLGFMLSAARELLRGHDLLVFPDRDAAAEWEQTAKRDGKGLRIKVEHWWERTRAEEKWDLADVMMADAALVGHAPPEPDAPRPSEKEQHQVRCALHGHVVNARDLVRLCGESREDQDSCLRLFHLTDRDYVSARLACRIIHCMEWLSN